MLRSAYDCAPKRYRAQFLCLLARAALLDETKEGCVRMAQWSQAPSAGGCKLHALRNLYVSIGCPRRECEVWTSDKCHHPVCEYKSKWRHKRTLGRTAGAVLKEIRPAQRGRVVVQVFESFPEIQLWQQLRQLILKKRQKHGRGLKRRFAAFGSVGTSLRAGVVVRKGCAGSSDGCSKMTDADWSNWAKRTLELAAVVMMPLQPGTAEVGASCWKRCCPGATTRRRPGQTPSSASSARRSGATSQIHSRRWGG